MVKKPSSFTHGCTLLSIGPRHFLLGSQSSRQRSGIKEDVHQRRLLADDQVAADATIYDSDRSCILRSYLTQLQRGVSEGSPVKGLLPLEPSRQLSVGGWIRRNGFGISLRRLQDAEADSQALCRVYPQNMMFRNALV